MRGLAGIARISAADIPQHQTQRATYGGTGSASMSEHAFPGVEGQYFHCCAAHHQQRRTTVSGGLNGIDVETFFQYGF